MTTDTPATATPPAPTAARPSLSFRAAAQVARWLTPVGVLLLIAGYVGPWVNHQAAGLVISGLDFAEYVKFLPEVRSGETRLWREAFYLPLVSASLSLSLMAYRIEYRLPYLVRLLLVALSLVIAANLLPPAWSPGILFTPEFRLQTLVLGLCTLTALCSPFLALWPFLAARMVALLPAIAAATLPITLLAQVWPAIEHLYAAPLQLGWGPFLMVPGIAVALAGLWLTPHPITRPTPTTPHSEDI